MANRYKVLLDIVREAQPYHVVEIGTWNGKRACEFMAVTDCFYTGFDLFEEANRDLDAQELNVKAHNEIVEVAKRIEMAGLSKFALFRGNTRETLPDWIDNHYKPFDFAFIDGGHSVETIKSDFDYIYENIDDGGIIILDDYYKPEVEGFGCNFLEDKGEVIDTGDRYINGRVCMLKVIK